jgi:tetratricopeptide (TPR) repeat protein
MTILSGFYHRARHWAEAAEWSERCFLSTARMRGADDEDTLAAFDDLAHYDAHTASDEEALAIREHTATLAARVFGEAHEKTAFAIAAVGSSLYEVGRTEEAEHALRRAIALAERTAVDGPASQTLRHRLGDVLKDTGRYEEALATYPLEERRRLHGEGMPATIEVMNDVARIYRLMGRFEESERLFLETIASAEEHLGSVAWRTAASQGELARVYVDQERYDEAAGLLELAVARMAEGQGMLSQPTQALRARLRDVYLQLGRAEEAASLDALLAQIPRHGWSPLQATGEPDSFSGEDEQTAWAPMQPNAGDEWLEVDFDPPLPAHTVHIHESHTAGATVEVVLIDASGAEVGRIPVPDIPREAPAVVQVSFPSPGTPVRTVRVVLDTRRVVGWNEIDAVELIGPDARAWAVSARASSYYYTN